MGSIPAANESQVNAQEATIPISGKHVKFLCSFGGMILPRPSDGALRYAGGDTRIKHMRRDVSLAELAKKLADVYDQEEVIIKYQLPDDDLDTLVSVSCHDDLENMMEECEELLDRFPDGSVKLRLFLFSTSKPDVITSGKNYVDAVNGVSFTSTQSSDLSGADATIDATDDSDPKPDVSKAPCTSQLATSELKQDVVDPQQDASIDIETFQKLPSEVMDEDFREAVATTGSVLVQPRYIDDASSDLNSMIQSLCLENVERFHQFNKVIVPLQEVGGVSQIARSEVERIALEHSRKLAPLDVHTSYGISMGNVAQFHPVNGESIVLGIPFIASQNLFHETVNKHSANVVSIDESVNFSISDEQLKLTYGTPTFHPKVHPTFDEIKSPFDQSSKDGTTPQQSKKMLHEDLSFNDTFSMTAVIPEANPIQPPLNIQLGTEREPNAAGYIHDSTNQPSDCADEDHNLQQAQSDIGSSNDPITLEQQETEEEGVNQDSDLENNSDDEIVTQLEVEANPGFPLSDRLGRLQIIKNNDLEDIRILGYGIFGTVYHGKWRGTDVAIKRINDTLLGGKPSEKERMREDFWNEAINLADLHHPNVVTFYGIVLDGPGGSVAIVTELMANGSLRNALQKNEGSLGKRKRLLIAMGIAFGMEYLHSKSIVHYDLKSDNLLVNLRDPHRPICKVADLGLSKVKCHTLLSGGGRGTLPWMAPEHFNGNRLVSEKVDVFSFGIVLWELLTGEEPYSDLHNGAIFVGIASNTLRPPVPDNCDCDWRSLMEKCWSTNPSERPSFTEIADELRSMLAKIPPKGHGSAPKTRTSA